MQLSIKNEKAKQAEKNGNRLIGQNKPKLTE
jgi:hypothetical protein